jgi:hypothetical protein
MKYIWPLTNTALIFLLFMYVFVTKDINTKAYDECKVLEERLDATNKFVDAQQKRDTIVIFVYPNDLTKEKKKK